MLLREDTCCHGACARPADESTGVGTDKMRSVAESLDDAGCSGASVRQRILDEKETRQALSRKRPKTEAGRQEQPIDLTADD